MGNKIDLPKIEKSIESLSTNSSNQDIDEFKTIYQAVNGNISNNQEFKDFLNKCIRDMKEEYILVLINNLVKYIDKQTLVGEYLKLSIELLSVIIDSIYTRYGNLRPLIILGVVENTTHDCSNSFPFNILILTTKLYSNDNLFTNKDIFKNQLEIFEVANLLSKIIYNMIYYTIDYKTSVDYLDIFKLFYSSIDNEIVYKFLVGLFLNVFINFKNYVDDILDPNLSRKHLESYIIHNFYILLWFCVDINKFFFQGKSTGEYIFQNEFNTIVYTLCKNKLFKDKNLLEVIETGNKFITDSMKNIFLYNTHIVRNFILLFFNNEDKFKNNLNNNVKILLIYFFELNQV